MGLLNDLENRLHRQSLDEFLARSLQPHSRWTFWRR